MDAHPGRSYAFPVSCPGGALAINWIFISIIGYILLQLLVCFAVMRRMNDEQDYLLAGRRLGMPMIAMTIFATWFGAEACIGAAGIIYDEGLSGSRADPFGYALCIFFLGLFFARKLWQRKITTLADFYRQRYGPQVEKLGVLLLVPASVFWAAAQILAFGHVLTSISTLQLDIAIAFAAIIVITYTALGGLLADAVSDIIQGTVLIIGLVVIFVVVMADMPDTSVLAEALSPERLSFRGQGESWMGVINSWSIPFIGSLFAAELVTRMLASRSPQVARNGALLGGMIYLIVGLMPATLGLLGPALMPGLEDGEQILPMLAQTHLHTVAYIMFIGALMSAILSTVDSALLNAGALVSHNIVVPMLGSTNEHLKVRYARISVVSFGVIAWVLARGAESVYSLVEESSAFGSAGIFTCCLMGLTQNRGGQVTAMSSMLAGIISYGVLAFVVKYEYAYLMSLVCALLTFFLLMWFESEPVQAQEPITQPIA
jgi:SSS family solute:Na+ symporter